MKKGTFKQRFLGVIAGIAAIIGGGQQANADTVITGTPSTINKKEVRHEYQRLVVPTAEKNKFGGFSGTPNPFKYHKKGYKNQRQKRKEWAQNPHLRKKNKRK